MLEWAVSDRPLPGEPVSGDRALVSVDGDGRALAFVVDGIGHGSEAAHAAERAVRAVEPAPSRDVVALAERCHAELAGTRGAAIAIATIDGASGLLAWLGVGNVEGRIVHGDRGVESLRLAPGMVGHRLPRLCESAAALGRGDLLLLATDGIEPGFADALRTHGSCEEIAARVLAAHGRASDDALVLACRYLGDGR